MRGNLELINEARARRARRVFKSPSNTGELPGISRACPQMFSYSNCRRLSEVSPVIYNVRQISRNFFIESPSDCIRGS